MGRKDNSEWKQRPRGKDKIRKNKDKNGKYGNKHTRMKLASIESKNKKKSIN